jgi:hypothetical protein
MIRSSLRAAASAKGRAWPYCVAENSATDPWDVSNIPHRASWTASGESTRSFRSERPATTAGILVGMIPDRSRPKWTNRSTGDARFSRLPALANLTTCERPEQS